MIAPHKPTSQQLMFRDMVLGTLLYAVVLGFFNDYTNILHTRSYSTTFSVAIVLQALTYATFALKDRVVAWYKPKEGRRYQVAMGFSVWLIMFLSKFVFLGVISVIFRDAVEISGFIGLLLIIICLTAAQKLVEYTYQKLGE